MARWRDQRRDDDRQDEEGVDEEESLRLMAPAPQESYDAPPRRSRRRREPDPDYDDDEEGFQEVITDTVKARVAATVADLPPTAQRIMELALKGGTEDDLQALLVLEEVARGPA